MKKHIGKLTSMKKQLGMRYFLSVEKTVAENEGIVKKLAEMIENELDELIFDIRETGTRRRVWVYHMPRNIEVANA